LPGSDIPATTTHISDAIAGSGNTRQEGGKAPFFLRYSDKNAREDPFKRKLPPNGSTGMWYDFEPSCLKWNDKDTNGIPPGYKRWKYDRLVCDEYPFAVTKQGGFFNYLYKNEVSIRPVPAWEQDISPPGQGYQIRQFHNGAPLTRNHDLLGWYLVIPNLGDKSSYINRAGDRIYF
jgi:hypothetical protein